MFLHPPALNATFTAQCLTCGCSDVNGLQITNCLEPLFLAIPVVKTILSNLLYYHHDDQGYKQSGDATTCQSG